MKSFDTCDNLIRSFSDVYTNMAESTSFLEGYRKIQLWLNGILHTFTADWVQVGEF
jgi:hypothetical protein